MGWIFVVLAGVLVFAIAAAFVGSEAFRLGHEVPAAIFDLDEAVDTVADGLPLDAQGRLTHDEVRTLIVAALGHLHNKGLSALPGEEIVVDADHDVTVVDDEAAAVLLGAIDTAHLDVTDEDAHLVLHELLAYLDAIGALGPRA